MTPPVPQEAENQANLEVASLSNSADEDMADSQEPSPTPKEVAETPVAKPVTITQESQAEKKRSPTL